MDESIGCFWFACSLELRSLSDAVKLEIDSSFIKKIQLPISVLELAKSPCRISDELLRS